MEQGLHDRDRVGVDDFVLLENYQSEAAFIENLRKRFKENLIYTYIGQVLVSVNPYKNLPIYTPGIIKDYQKTHFYEASPHIFGLTDTAYRSLKEENKNQCILISGESGSGKTEASKKVLLFIAAATGHKKNVEVVKDKLVQSNPLLEAFGNAKTNRNVNSSRFGKYMDVQFDFLGDPVGGNILNYLLEKSRVIHQSPGERNFHIFYQLLSGATDDELKQLFLKRNFDTYFYLTDGSKGRVNNIDDVSQFKEVKKAMSVIDIPNDEQEEILKVVASILHMGNIGFTENDTVASILKPESVEAVAKLLGCNPLQLRAALLNRTIKARGEFVTSPLNRDMAICARDALAKAVYDRLFTWLVTCLNKSLQPKQTSETAVMGILDIYGFEIFQKNSFEQFCINFCNEKLQQLFIELTLKSEQEEYLKEGIEWEPVQYFNNKIICDLIEEKHKGIISLMDEECLRPGDSTDMSFLAKMNDQLINHEHYISHKKADLKTQKTMGRDEFRLIHYAGNVTYNVDGFLEKNNDLLFRDLREVMSQTTNKITKEIFPLKDLESKKRPESAATQFKNSLNNLMEILMSKEPSYIRCIKPNDDQKSNTFNDEIVTHQVKYLGLMENLRVRRAGFAYRRPYESFLERYKSLCTSTWPNYHGPAKQGVQVLVCSLAYEKDEYRMGNTKIFIRFPKTLFHTEDAFQAKKHAIAAIIQAAWKGLMQRRKYLEMRKAAIVIEKWIRRFLAKKDAEKRKKAVLVIRRFIRGFITRNDDPNSDNKNFMELAKAHWLNRLATSLPKSVLDKSWPPCPVTCRSASEFLQSFYMKYLSKKYRLALTPEIKSQFELKVLAESLFKDKKKNYKQSIPHWFKDDRVSADEVAAKNQYIVTKTQPNGEKVQYCTNVKKYDRHGYKPRQRIMILTDKTLYILETKTMKLKHSLVLNLVEFVVSSESDGVCLVRIPLELKKDKGDLILEVPHIIEAMTMIIKTTKKPNSLNIVNTGSISHQLNNGKQGVIEVTQGTPADIHKNKNGHLIVVAVP